MDFGGLRLKTLSKGVRLPIKLYDLVISANPGKSFSEIVCCALSEKYSFKILNEVCTDNKLESKLDKLFNKCAQEQNKP